jgi:hypothetical protein
MCSLPDMKWGFHFCGSCGLGAGRLTEDVPGGDMKSRLIAVVIHKRGIYIAQIVPPPVLAGGGSLR